MKIVNNFSRVKKRLAYVEDRGGGRDTYPVVLAGVEVLVVLVCIFETHNSAHPFLQRGHRWEGAVHVLGQAPSGN
jgi:hypothetical protein